MGCVCTPGEEDELDTHDDARRLLRHDEMCPTEFFIRDKAVRAPGHFNQICRFRKKFNLFNG